MPLPISKKHFKILIIFFLLLAIPLTVLLALSRQEIRKKASEPQAPPNQLKHEYAPGEVLIKLKTPLDNSALESNNLPPVLKKLKDQYKINSIEKVFKGTEDPQKEIDKFKQKFSQEISTGKRKINEEQLSQIDLSRTYKLSFDPKASVEDVIREISKNPEIDYAEPNFIFKTQLIPNDPYYLDHYPDQIVNRDPNWNPPYDYQWNLKKINMEQAWDITTGNQDIVLAVIDTGVDYTHPDLGGCNLQQVNENLCLKVMPGYDFINNDNDPIDDFGHGTHVAGLIAGNTNDSSGIASLVWDGRLMPVKVLDANGSGTMDQISPGIVFAANNGARIINMSFGSRDPYTPISPTLKNALDTAYYHNVVLIAAAGNSRQKYLNCPNGFWPADYRFVIEVAASKQDDFPSSYSNCSKDIAAPGGEASDIISYASSLVAWNPNYLIGNDYIRKSGTSMAAPHAAALASLVFSLHPEYTNEEVRSVIKTGADPMWNVTFGSGRINAYRTLISDNPVISFLTKPTEDESIDGVVPIEAIFKKAILSNNYLSVAEGWHTSTHDGSFIPRNDGITLSNPDGSSYWGTIAYWDTSLYGNGIYTIWLHSENGTEDFLHVKVNHLTPTTNPTPTPTPTLVSTPTLVPTQTPTPTITSTPTPITTPVSTPTPTPQIKTLTFNINIGSDDAYQEGDINKKVVINDSKLKLGWYVATTGFRLKDDRLINLKGKTITNARLALTALENTSSLIKLRIRGEKSGICQTFSTTQNNLGSRNKTSNFVDWQPNSWNMNTRYNSPNLSQVVSEIVQMSDFQGKNLCLYLKNSGSANYTQRLVSAKEDSTRKPATLTITYY